ncbi:MAG TPA: ABC transporter permease [Candidatus Polarisedimenticolia bacterium]|nr:ABC transporter permease [Candidatus Polarisedimenticolia bacterium]
MAEKARPGSSGALRSLGSHLRRDPFALSGATLLLLMGLVAVAAPVLAPFAPSSQDLAQRFAAPSLAHPLGLDELGRDILSRLMFGARISLFLSIVVVLFSALTGLAIGTMAGFWGGWLDDLVMRGIDILLAFPNILLAISLVAVLGPGLGNLVLALCLIGWVGYARLSRAQILRSRELEFVLSARAAGARSERILVRHLLPNIAGPIIVQATVGMAGVILAEAGLSFLGLGLPPPHPSWGSMLRSGSQHLFDAPHLIVYPGLAIMLAVLSFNFLGDSIRDWLDPRLQRSLDPGR